MKKQIFLAAAAALALASCTQSDELATSPGALSTITQDDNTVRFGTYQEETGTRAGRTGAITTSPLLAEKNSSDEANTKGFGVFAYYTNATAYSNTQSTGSQKPNFMYNQQVNGTVSGSTVTGWTYSPIKYWPNDFSNEDVDNQSAQGSTATAGKVSFFAYAPYCEPGGSETEGIISLSSNTYTFDPYVEYKLPTTPLESNTVDLLWGTRGESTYDLAHGTDVAHVVGSTYNTDLTKEDTGEKVNFLFKHALAKFGGSTEGTLGGVWVALDIDGARTSTGDGQDHMSLWNSSPQYTLVTVKSFKIENGVASGPGALKQEGKFDLATGTWFDLTTDYTFSDEETSDASTVK